MKKKHLVVLSGAGVSADSGLETFRDSEGLWAKYRIEDVCTPEALEKNPGLVLKFYNERRRQLLGVVPNEGHFVIAELENYFDVDIITQNIDDLHERAGSSRVLHLHGELLKCRSMKDPSFIGAANGDINIGDTCPMGGQLRPHVVFFGEDVPEMERAEEIIHTADILVIVGTSLAVYPAAGLVRYVPGNADIYVVDPSEITLSGADVTYIRERSVTGMPKLLKLLIRTI